MSEHAYQSDTSGSTLSNYLWPDDWLMRTDSDVMERSVSCSLSMNRLHRFRSSNGSSVGKIFSTMIR